MAIHAQLGASSAERWFACPGSIRESAGRPNISTSYAIQGTAAHEVAAMCLRENRAAIEFLGRYIDVDAGYEVAGKPHIEKILCDEDMVNGVQVYLDLCAEEEGQPWLDPDAFSIRFIEHKVNLAPLAPGLDQPLFGTCDFGVYRRHDKTLVGIDFKYGKGVVVEVTGKPQVRYYLAGLLCDPALAGEQVDFVEVVICQPRAWHEDGPIRRERLTTEELLDWVDNELIPAARRTQEPDAPLAAGDHCTFCLASADCEERRRHELGNAMIAFGDVDAVPERGAMPPPVDSLTPEQRSRMLDVLDRFLGYARDFREDAFRRLSEDPASIPGWKVVGRKGHRRWMAQTPEETVAQLAYVIGVPPADCYARPKLKSPAQIMETIKKLNRPHEVKRLNITLSNFYEVPMTGTTLARDSDPRIAVLGTDLATFEALE